MQHVKKAVFPVAGMGTRFLPATKANPKEMLPIVDKPLIQYAAEEAVSAGIEVLVFVYGRHKRAIGDHFDKAYELEKELEEKGKTKMLEVARNILPAGIDCVYIRQAEALGLGHAVHCAKPVIGDEPFAVILADDMINPKGTTTCLQQMVDVYNYHHTTIVGVEPVPEENIGRYGVVSGSESSDSIIEMNGIVEKPAAKDAPSNLGVVGRYILTPAIFEHIERLGKGTGGEIQLTDAIATLMAEERVLAYKFKGKRFDCGSKLGYLQATVEYALEHSELKKEFRAYLKTLKI
ncbi:MAG: UTP--glucose-1-phosphate uridylyltransferase GalU [Gammaproteobacteria bacterium]|nr:UTP--glucose-1-phosphate uridylyltransferase GalU [Gammaproteobacteria bacterium]